MLSMITKVIFRVLGRKVKPVYVSEATIRKHKAIFGASGTGRTCLATRLSARRGQPAAA